MSWFMTLWQAKCAVKNVMENCNEPMAITVGNKSLSDWLSPKSTYILLHGQERRGGGGGGGGGGCAPSPPQLFIFIKSVKKKKKICVQTAFEGYHLPTSCKTSKSTQCTASSSKGVSYSLEQLDLVLSLCFHYLLIWLYEECQNSV